MVPFAASFLEWGTVAAGAASFVFLIGATWIFPWYDSLAGRAMVTIDAALFVALFPAFLHFVFGLNTNTIFFVWYYGASLWVVALATLWRLFALWRVQRQGLRDAGG